MKKKIILSIFLLAMLVSVFALTVGAMELGNYYDISKNESSNVSARLEENRECAGTYTLYISGNGEMRDFSARSQGRS